MNSKCANAMAATAIAIGAVSLWTHSDAVAQDAAAKVSFTAAQADRGKTEYARSCMDCHGANLDDGEFGGAPLKGTHFNTNWGGQTADALVGYISTAMPPDRPGRLSPQTYADITAFILRGNGFTAGPQELPPDLEKLSQFVLEK